MSENPVVGHKTFQNADGSYRHEPLHKEEADALLAAVDAAEKDRAARMPDEKAAIHALFDAWLRLKELGWRDAVYCPKDGTPFQIIEAGSTGIFGAYYQGEWPEGYIISHDEHDSYVSRPSHTILFKPADEAASQPPKEE